MGTLCVLAAEMVTSEGGAAEAAPMALKTACVWLG